MRKQKAISRPQALPFILCGFGLTWAVIFVFAYGLLFPPANAEISYHTSLISTCFLFGIVISEFTIYRFSPRLTGRLARKNLATAATICLIAMGVSAVIAQTMNANAWIYVFLALIPGLWEGVFHLLWGEILTRFDDRRLTSYMYASVVLGALLFIFTTLSLGINGIIMLVILGTLSFFCLFYIVDNEPESNTPENNTANSHQFKSIQNLPKIITGLHGSWRYLSLFVIYGVVFGFSLFSSIQDNRPQWSNIAIGVSLAAGVALLLVSETLRGKSIAFNDIARLILPFLAIELVPIPFVDQQLRWLLWLLLIMTMTMFDTSSFAFLARLSQANKPNELGVIAQGRLFIQMGMLFGSTASFILNSFIDVANSYALYIPPVLIILLFFVVTFMGSFEPLSQNAVMLLSNPRDSGDIGGISGTDAPFALENHYRISERVSKLYGLTKRESDVLELLIMGHTAHSISVKLVLSTSTVKTHIYHMYQKLQVNSKEELLEVVDKTRH